jgi:hypothetical protein
MKEVKLHNELLRIDLIRGTLELAMLQNAVLTKTTFTDTPAIDIPDVTTFLYPTYYKAKQDFDVIQDVLNTIDSGGDPKEYVYRLYDEGRVTLRQMLWNEDAEEMHKLLAWVHSQTFYIEGLQFYETQDDGILFMASVQYSPTGQVFINYDDLEKMMKANLLNLNKK